MKKTVRTVALYIFAALLAVLCLFTTAASSFLSARVAAYAEELTGLLDKTSIENDLKELDLSGYSAEAGLQIVYFAEIGFSRSSSEDYGLYVYVYNPDGIAFNTSLTGSNVLNMAVSFNSTGEATGYRNMQLTFIDRTDDHLYYKFKVTDSATMYTVATEYAELWNCRRYEIAGVQLWEYYETQAHDYEVALAYIYSGYAKGYSTQSAEESTLSCTVEESRVITFSDLQQTYYRYPQDYYNFAELKTVYFSIPNEVLDYYGEIYSIQAEYYEYDLQPIVVVSDSDVYNGLLDYVGVDLSGVSSTPYSIAAIEYLKWAGTNVYYYYNWRYGKGITVSFLGDTHNATDDADVADKLVYLFYADDYTDYTISAKELISYMDAYTTTNGGGSAYGGYNDDLFYADSAGYSGATYIDITADDLFDIGGFDLGSSFMNWWADLIYGYDNEDIENIEPIHVVTESDLNSSDLSNTLYIAEEDEDDFVAYCKQEMAAGNTVYMFRYKVDDYADESGHIWVTDDWITASWEEKYCSVRFATVDLGFDIISLGFAGENGLTIVAAVSDPINVIPDLESGSTIFDDTTSGVSWATISVVLLVGVGGIAVTRIIKKYAK